MLHINENNLNNIDSSGNTILHNLILFNCEDVNENVCYVLSQGINVDIKNNDGDTALHLIDEKNIHLAKYVLSYYANPLIKNNKGETFMDKYCSWNSIYANYITDDILHTLKHINCHDKNGNTLLHKYCVKFCYIPIIKYLIDNDFDVNEKNNDGNTPLHLNVFDILSYKHMLMKLKNINTVNNNGETILHSLYKSDKSLIVKKELTQLLKYKKINMDIVDNKGKTARQYLTLLDRMRMIL